MNFHPRQKTVQNAVAAITPALLLLACRAAHAHGLDAEIAPGLSVHGMQLAQVGATPTAKTPTGTGSSRPTQAAVFESFSPKVSVRWDDRFLYVESYGLPAHPMMVGITNWQQHVPIPQRYTGTNAWRIPLSPVVANTPTSIKGRFLRGAIALAANGVPIFNPQNNRGEVAAEIGELDRWGGHCGRADDYHYHAAPLHLQSVVGPGKPIAYALDGYPILGLNESDGSKPVGLDAFNGHPSGTLGYHYHASLQYPYVNGGFHGEVVEREGQVDPQPSGQPIRGALPPLPGATITNFEVLEKEAYKLTFQLNGEQRFIRYAPNPDGSYTFDFQNGRDGASQQTFTRGRGGGDGLRQEGPPPENQRPRPGGPQPSPQNGPQNGPPPRPNTPQSPALSNPGGKAPNNGFVLSSPEVSDGGNLPIEYSGDGAGSTLPLEWSGAPADTKSFTLVMHHLDPEGKTKWYWILYNLPETLKGLPKNVSGIGTQGSNFQGRVGYQPPHSKGPGAKTYVLTLYALSSSLEIRTPATSVSFDSIQEAMKGKILAKSDLSVVYTRTGTESQPPSKPGPPPTPREAKKP